VVSMRRESSSGTQVLVGCNSQIGSKYRAAIDRRSETRRGGIVRTMPTTSNEAVAVEGKRDAIDLAVTVH
jgi:hypothetical protein